MPMYSFVCSRCGRAFEELLPVSRREEGTCPECGAAASRRLNAEGFAVGVARKDAAPSCPGCPGAGGCGHEGCPGCCGGGD